MRTAWLLPGSLALATLGMAAVVVGVITPALFYPGAIMIALGLVLCALAGVLRLTLERTSA